MKIALLQVNPTVGNLTGNTASIPDALCQAATLGAELAVTPELAWGGPYSVSCSAGSADGNMPPAASPSGALSRHRRCIHSQNSGWRRTYISSTSVQRCVNS
jgi:predicted amidohydrolase